MLETDRLHTATKQNSSLLLEVEHAMKGERGGEGVVAHSLPRAKVFMASAISSCVGGSATTGMLLAAPLGTQDMAEIIPLSESSSIG